MGSFNIPPWIDNLTKEQTIKLILLGLFGSTPPSGNGGISVAGTVKIDQTTPGTTNGVQVNAALPAGANTLGKVGAAQSSAAPTNTAGTAFTILTTGGDVFTLAAGESGFIQNHDDAVLNFKLGTGASTTSLSGRLKACAVADDGSGGYIRIENWIGVVSVAAAAGSPRFSAWKI